MNVIIFPIIWPLSMALLAVLTRSNKKLQILIATGGMSGYVLSIIWIMIKALNTGPLVLHIGNWMAPFGITLVADSFSALLLALTAVIAVTTCAFIMQTINPQTLEKGFLALFFTLVMGVSGAFLTGDLFNLYVWFEVVLISSFVLLVIEIKPAELFGSLKYVMLNLVASMFFLAGIGILYSTTGTLNMADLALKIQASSGSAPVSSSAMLFLLAFGIKSAVFPLFFWLPDSYHIPSSGIVALFSGLLTKVGLYAFFRVFTLIFGTNSHLFTDLFTIIAIFTMTLGVIGAVAQQEMKRLLSFHIVSQIGYAIMGLALYSPQAFAAAIYFIIHVSIAKSALFLVAGVIEKTNGSTDLKKLGGFANRPWLASLFLLAAFSLAGLPPLSGFIAKYGLVKAGLEQQAFVLVFVALAVSFLTLFSMTKIWKFAFWGENRFPESKESIPLLLPIMVLSGLTVGLGLSRPLYEIALLAANELMQPAAYIQAVMGGSL
jgi:multicomponent Na+:H+ antiporter subunit D